MFWEVKSQEPTFLTKSGRPDQFYPRTQVHSPHPGLKCDHSFCRTPGLKCARNFCRLRIAVPLP